MLGWMNPAGWLGKVANKLNGGGKINKSASSQSAIVAACMLACWLRLASRPFATLAEVRSFIRLVR